MNYKYQCGCCSQVFLLCSEIISIDVSSHSKIKGNEIVYPLLGFFVCPNCNSIASFYCENKYSKMIATGGSLVDSSTTIQRNVCFTNIQRDMNDFCIEESVELKPKDLRCLVVDKETKLISQSVLGAFPFEFNIFPSLKGELVDCLNVHEDSDYRKITDSFAKRYSRYDGYSKCIQNINPGNAIFALSDFPVEWMEKNDVPLSFLNDVCRLPYQYDKNFYEQYLKRFSSAIKLNEKTLKKTWVVMCAAHDKKMHCSYFTQITTFEEKGFKNYKLISSKEELIEFLNNTEIDILIFDTHGGKDDYLDSTQLSIGPKDFFSSSDINSLTRDIPIVFLSACWTNPPKNYSDNIAEAFIKKGSLSVTSTYFTMDIYKGMQMICRLINNLQYACSHRVHSNWLDFIAHNIRTVKVQSLAKILSKEPERVKSQSIEVLEKVKSHLSQDKDVVGLIDNAIQTKDLKEILGIEQTIVLRCPSEREFIYKKWMADPLIMESSEMLFYSNLGRSDLIEFEMKENPAPNEKWNERVDRSIQRVKMMADLWETMGIVKH